MADFSMRDQVTEALPCTGIRSRGTAISCQPKAYSYATALSCDMQLVGHDVVRSY